MQIKTFSKSQVALPLPYLLHVQRAAWNTFWERDVKELFAEISPIRDYTGKELELWFLDYKLDEPKYKDYLEAKINDDSFEATLRARTRLVNLKTKEIKEQEVFLVDFPLMTEQGFFVVNGVERVIISQLIRSPGSFFTAAQSGGKNYFGAKIIPNRGAWLEFETESSGFIGVKIDRKRKAPVTTLLKAFGVEGDEKIRELFRDVDRGEIKYIEETLARDLSRNRDEAVVEIYRRLRPGDPVTSDPARELIENMFFNFARYDLSRVGRWKTMQRLPALQKSKTQISKLKTTTQKSKLLKSEEEITPKDRVLRLEDVVEVVREIIRLNNDSSAQPDQIDHLGNRRVRSLNELMQNRLRIGLMRMERIIKDRMSTLDVATITPVQLINPRPFMAVVKEFFTSSQLAQFMDNENPLAELEHKRRLSATGPGGLTRERAGFEVRDVQPSHYGRICPIQTPEGPNVGLVGHMAGYSRVNSYGFLEAPYFKVKNGRVTDEIRYLNAYEEERANIAHGGVPIDKNGRIVPDLVSARIKGEPGQIARDQIDYIDVSAEQFVSVATSCIPFLQNDDANRALMGSNMQRQAVPLVNPEMPVVATGVEERVARDSGRAVYAEEAGLIIEADANHIKVKSLASGDSSSAKPKITNYELRSFVRTNQYTCFHQKPMVKKGQRVKRGDVLADGGAIDRGWLALGQNITVAFMSWRGGNFEDAILLSERLVQEDKYTSVHIEDFTCDIRETKLGPEITTADIPNVGEEKLKDLDEEGVVRIGAEVSPGDILVGKISPKGETDLTAEERLLRAIFGEKARDIKDTSLRMQHGKRGRVVSVRIFSRELGHKLEPGVIKRIRVEVAQLRKIQAGDKLAGRHGNKGVISKVLPAEEMPFMQDGTPVDIVLNPLSVASRMNIGQILETHLGWAASKLGYLAVTPSLAGATEEDIKKELREAGLPEDGKMVLYDGRTGLPFPKKITVGRIYMMKLIHMVEDKMHMRSIGPYSLITQQPLGGKAQFGGQRFGEMEVWALEGYGAAHTLQEMLTIKSDDVPGRAATYEAILKGEPIQHPGVPASFNLLVNELKALGLSVEVKEKPKE
ncbi:MAG: DNA-directed RNA polymerase subunit beta [Candidatus Wildermuthbacteria bacterium RIFCSPHIGHO2_01_FULL_47_27]|uniref:DNA-directed RNA polymerase subunit beta n=2 Tax=Candidatus Wildermuthiibacteriota TaxID=1817923 RepID=A0A1G2RST3_9BACT|nr:MAG: DNA-directed RNA polymerase subunit beta [Candidatus Wildermuthbacteria bacterium RIFCSPHIGHO2_01_FULL_47_27]OHA68925.1 MAG: DNA-directed RNA polymerase subunit beta [Candidatus Wildermuthbacteria bacterium RIFCSPHIGHO2_02_FULL_47_17]OHA75528.1 MAG: DNA-directed RNA polymerase subunit beta [Candidatus Wildermuthbacteria bacterium RIFCSPLOWO2_01_FULL_48_35]